MMNQWWFKLYTIHFIKKSLKWSGLAVGLDMIIGILGLGQEFPISILVAVPFLPIFVKIIKLPMMRANLDFHKLNIPLPALRKAFYLDYIVSFLAATFFSLCIIGCSHLLSGAFASDPDNFLAQKTVIELAYYYLVMMAGILYAYGVETNLEKRKLIYKNFTATILRRINSFFFLGLCFSFMFFSSMFITSEVFTSTAVWMFAGVTITLLHQRKYLFNIIPPALNYRRYFVYYIQGNAISACLFLCFAFLARSNVFDDSLSAKQRVSSFEFTGVLAPRLDIETFKVIEPKFQGISHSRLYSNLDFDPSTLGVDYYLNNKGYTRLLLFLYDGKPSTEFLTRLYEHLETDPYWKDKKGVESVKHLAYGTWPQKKPFPERFMVSKLELAKIRKQYQAERAAKKAKVSRAAASENE